MGGHRGRFYYVRDSHPGSGIVAKLRRRIFKEIQWFYPHLLQHAGGADARLIEDEDEITKPTLKLGTTLSGAQG